MKKSAKTVAIGTLIAGAVGYIAGILTAPKSGAETRSSLRDAGETSILEAEKQLKKLHTELNELLGEASAKGKETVGKLKSDEEALQGDVVGTATRARQKTREILSAIHDGNADDRDLDKAVNEATKAIKSIRSYLKK